MMAGFKNRLQKKHIVLVVAIAFGGLGAYGANVYLNSQMEEIRKLDGATVPVIVAKEDLPAGTGLSPETVSIRNIPGEWVQSGAVKPEEFDSIDNALLKVPLNRGEMIMWPMIEKADDRAVAAMVAKGRRAITLSVDEISSLSGMLKPGNLVDLIVTDDQQDNPVSFPLLQQVRVIATGAKLHQQEGNDAESYTTITLDTTPEEARKIIAARDGGRVTAILRNDDDRQPMANYRLSLRDLSTPPKVVLPVGQTAAKPARPDVRVVYGDQP